MNYLDIIILAVISLLTTIGIQKGIVKTLAGIIGFFVALFIATNMVGIAADRLMDVISFGKSTAYIVGFISLFVCVILVFKIAAQLLLKLFEITSTRWIDRLGGALFGFLTGAMILSALFMLLSFFSFTDSFLPEREKSFLYEPVRDFFPVVYDTFSGIGPTSDKFQDVLEKFFKDSPAELLEKSEAGRNFLEYLNKLKDIDLK